MGSRHHAQDFRSLLRVQRSPSRLYCALPLERRPRLLLFDCGRLSAAVSSRLFGTEAGTIQAWLSMFTCGARIRAALCFHMDNGTRPRLRSGSPQGPTLAWSTAKRHTGRPSLGGPSPVWQARGASVECTRALKDGPSRGVSTPDVLAAWRRVQGGFAGPLPCSSYSVVPSSRRPLDVGQGQATTYSVSVR